MTEQELISPIRETASAISQELDVFLAARFAVIPAVHAVGEKPGVFPRILLAALYMAATSLFCLRYESPARRVSFSVRFLIWVASFLNMSAAFLRHAGNCLGWGGSLAAVLLVFHPLATRAQAAKSKANEPDT